MKRTAKRALVFIFCSLVTVLSFLSCPGPGLDNNNNADPEGFLGETLVIKDAAIHTTDGAPYTGLHGTVATIPDKANSGLLPIAGVVTGASGGLIRNGVFSLSLGTPQASSLRTLGSLFTGDSDVVITNAGVNVYQLSRWGLLLSDGREVSGALNYRAKDHIVLQTEPIPNYFYSTVQYWYSEGDAAITGTRTRTSASGITIVTTYSITLQKGWNTVIAKDALYKDGAVTVTRANGEPDKDLHQWISETYYGALDPVGFLGDSLSIQNALVYESASVPWSGEDAVITTHSSGKSLADDFTGTADASVTANRLNASLGVPKQDALEPLTAQEGLSVSKAGAKIYTVSGFDLPVSGGDDAALVYGLYDEANETSFTVAYWYASSDVTITGSTTSGTRVTFDNVALYAGWNVLLTKTEGNGTAVTYSNGEPSSGYKWLYAANLAETIPEGFLGPTLSLTGVPVYDMDNALDLSLNATLIGVNGEGKPLADLFTTASGAVTGGAFTALLGAPANPISPSMLPGLVLSDPEAKGYSIMMWDIELQNGKQGQMAYQNDGGVTIMPPVMYYYMDRDLTITGTVTGPAGPSLTGATLSVTYDLTLKKGWTSVIIAEQSLSQDETFADLLLRNGLPKEGYNLYANYPAY